MSDVEVELLEIGFVSMPRVEDVSLKLLGCNVVVMLMNVVGRNI